MPEKTERNEQIRHQRYIEGMTLEEIGVIHGITRERVRQIVPDTGNYRAQWTRDFIRDNPDVIHVNRDEIKNLPGVKKEWSKIWGKTWHEPKDGYQKEHFLFVNRLKDMLRDIGIQSEIVPFAEPHDLLTKSGMKISVGYTNTDVSRCPSQNSTSYPTWAVPNLGADPTKYDYAVAFIPYAGDYTFFVIPSSEIGYRSRNSRIRIPFPQMGNKPSKWHKWHERIDLIK